ncbi:DUF5615 family PIN-like protein [Thermoflexus hugenholtzii]
MIRRFLVDEDMPRSTAIALREAGYEVEDVRDVSLRGSTDEEILAYARAREAVLITADKGFTNILRFPPRTHGRYSRDESPQRASGSGAESTPSPSPDQSGG